VAVAATTSPTQGGADAKGTSTVETVREDDTAAHLSGTEALELVRTALDVRVDESLAEAAQRAIDAYLTRPLGDVDVDVADRAAVAHALRLDSEPHEHLLRWAHVFEAAKSARGLLARLGMLIAVLCAFTTFGACSADVATELHEEHVLCEGQDASECAIAIHTDKIGPLSERCTELVRATTVTLQVHSTIAAACRTTRDVLGCVTSVTPDGAEVQVVNDSDRQNTTVHELLHVALSCSRGNPDASHTTFGAAWIGLQATEGQ